MRSTALFDLEAPPKRLSRNFDLLVCAAAGLLVGYLLGLTRLGAVVLAWAERVLP